MEGSSYPRFNLRVAKLESLLLTNCFIAYNQRRFGWKDKTHKVGVTVTNDFMVFCGSAFVIVDALQGSELTLSRSVLQ